MRQTDFLIIGGGLAGLTSAIVLGEIGKVTILTSGKVGQTATCLAQGGLAAVVANGADSFEQHFQDTLNAGAHANNKAAVRLLVKRAPAAIAFLQNCGVRFDRSLHREGGHSTKRIFHVQDRTGFFLQEQLGQRVLQMKNVSLLPHAVAFQLLQKENDAVCGAAFFNKQSKRVETCLAGRTILATGGTGGIFSQTTASESATGDGIALAGKAGATLQDLQFVQFHPTAFAGPTKGRKFLLSEALRGAGALLKNEQGERFCNELGTRDKLARAIFMEKFSTQKERAVFLDFRHRKESWLQDNFPSIFKKLQSFGLNLARDLIPVTSVAHFSCGGVKTDLQGRTDLPGLLAVGECACNGVHGANRLASNSLTECVVFAQSMCEFLQKEKVVQPTCKSWSGAITDFQEISAADLEKIEKIRTTMWANCGVVRKISNLKKALLELEQISLQSTAGRNLLFVARATLRAALESGTTGCHFLVRDS